MNVLNVVKINMTFCKVCKVHIDFDNIYKYERFERGQYL